MPASNADRLLVEQIRAGDQSAWKQCIDRFEGRLMAFAVSRIHDRAAAEDIVQDTFLGFLTALPNFDSDTPLESFLFAIAAHKMTDLFRRNGRRPVFSLAGRDSTGSPDDIAGSARVASSLARSRERHDTEAEVLADTLREMLAKCVSERDFERMKCWELMFVRGLHNKEVAKLLGLSEQDVANHKQFAVNKLKQAAKVQLREFNSAVGD